MPSCWPVHGCRQCTRTRRRWRSCWRRRCTPGTWTCPPGGLSSRGLPQLGLLCVGGPPVLGALMRWGQRRGRVGPRPKAPRPPPPTDRALRHLRGAQCLRQVLGAEAPDRSRPHIPCALLPSFAPSSHHPPPLPPPRRALAAVPASLPACASLTVLNLSCNGLEHLPPELGELAVGLGFLPTPSFSYLYTCPSNLADSAATPPLSSGLGGGWVGG
jgi:hypothetical protein